MNLRLLQTLIERSGINKGDTVYDIGTGTGVISGMLLKRGARVIGIEKDRVMFTRCKKKYLAESRFELYLDDFLQMDFPVGHETMPYKVFSNIPFVHTSRIINKLLYNDNPPEDCYLVIQKEAAEKYAGVQCESVQSLLLKPLFWVDFVYNFNQTDFFPVPSVDIVLVQFEKRRCRLVPAEQFSMYRQFVEAFMRGGSPTVKKALCGLFSWPQLKRLGMRFDIDFHSKPSQLSFLQVLGIFQFYWELIESQEFGRGVRLSPASTIRKEMYHCISTKETKRHFVQ